MQIEPGSAITDETGEVPPVDGPSESVYGFELPAQNEPISRPRALPVEGGERLGSVDVIRGVALMGILAMNIVNMAWPAGIYSIPVIDPDYGRWDMILWGFNHLIFDTKMMTLFSMLFGAGLVLMGERAEARGAKTGWIFYRRIFWLLVIGIIHSYLIWDGDILVLYASCGFLLYPTRRWSPKTLIIVGVCLNLLLVPLLLGVRFGLVPFMRRTAERVAAEAKEHPEKKPEWWEEKVRDGWKEMSKNEGPKHEHFMKEIATHRGPYWGMVKERAGSLIWGQTLGFVFGGWCFAGGRMLVGMGLMKLGVFAARRSSRAYLRMMAIGYGIGIPLLAFDIYHETINNFFLGRRLWYALDGWPLLTIYGSIPVVFGHIGLIMLICQNGSLPWLTRRLGAAGRMALSCYLFDSIVGTTLFYGHGFDLFGTLYRPLLYAIVLTIWTAQLLVCPLWLERFRFGPAEWAWRSLTYWKLQPMRAVTAIPASPGPTARPPIAI